MADTQPGEGSSASEHASGENSESTLQLNVKTLDSRICSFSVDKNTVVSAFKDKIAGEIGVPAGQQRLIFRGKVLTDDHLLSEYNLENGDTLHLVERQPQPSPGDQAASSNVAGLDSNAGVPRNLVGQIAHSVILGALNVGDQGDAVIPDLSRVIGAVLNSIGVGNTAGGMQPGVQSSLGNETEGSQANNAGSQSASYPMQTPTGAAIDLPTLNTPIPESLSTLTEFMNRMELAFSQNDTQENQPLTTSSNVPTAELPRDSLGYPTLQALTIVLQHAERLLRDHAVRALSCTASRLNEMGSSIDPRVRGQVQTESMQLGVTMQHLGALLLELGRTILTLRMGQSPGEGFVNAGPAVYISPSGPNPIMVQPFPLQTSSLFGDSFGVTPNPVAMTPASVGSIPRNVNIHIHTGAALEPIVTTVGNRMPTGEEMQGPPVSGTESGSVNQEPPPVGETTQTLAHPAVVEDQKSRSEPTTSSGKGPHNQSSTSEHAGSLKGLARSGHGNDNSGGSSATPLGLGLGGLQPKKRGGLPRSQPRKSDAASSSSQSLKSGPVPPVKGQNTDSNIDVTNEMSQVLRSPSLDGLLAGVSQQTGVGSPDMLRSMLQEFTENPEMRSTVNQLAQHIDSHDLGSMFAGLDRTGQGGGIDLSAMMQQMMPIVSQTLGGLPPMSQLNPPSERARSQSSSRRVMTPMNDASQINLQQVIQRLEDRSSTEEIFRSLVETAAEFSSNEDQSVVNELCSQWGLAQEFMEMLKRDITRRFENC